jgi:hypothetical protein
LPSDDILLTCQGVSVFEGNIGCVEDNIAILVNKVINKKIRDEL